MKRVIAGLKWAGKRYAVGAFSSMAQGLFATLIVGVIISQAARIPGLSFLSTYSDIVSAQSPVVGAAIGVAIAYGLKGSLLATLASAATGAFGYAQGGPIGAYFAAIVGAELGTLITGRTKVDILMVPFVTIITGCAAGQLIGPYVAAFMASLGSVVNSATQLAPVPMGMTVAGIIGLALTGPISSAGLSISLGLSGLAAGAATAGGAAQMVGFAVASYIDNGVDGVVAQGLGSSKLQLGNALRRPAILIAPTLAGMIVGSLSAAVFGLESAAVGAGMGTAALIGQITMVSVMQGKMAMPVLLFNIALLHIVLPAILTFVFDKILRKIGWIKPGDMKLPK